MTKISKKILIGAFAILMALAVIVMPFLYLKKTNKVYAESSSPVVGVQYIGSEMLIAFNTRSNINRLGQFRVAFKQAESGVNLLPILSRAISDSASTITGYTYNAFYNLDTNTYLGNEDNFIIPYNTNIVRTYGYKFSVTSTNNNDQMVSMGIYLSSSFNVSKLKGYSFGITTADDVQVTWTNYSSTLFVIRYFDYDNNYFEFTFPATGNLTNTFYMRTYYFNDTDVPDNWQAGYDSGYADGTNDGYDVGYDDGETFGEIAGFANGKQVGYNMGLAEANDYTFIGLIGATIDAPIKALTGLLNFEILGVNLSAFVYGLFSITLVIIIIRYIKGGK